MFFVDLNSKSRSYLLILEFEVVCDFKTETSIHQKLAMIDIFDFCLFLFLFELLSKLLVFGERVWGLAR